MRKKKEAALRLLIYFSALVVVAAGIVLTGIGAAASLDMRLVPNPGDGIVQTLADAAGKETGLVNYPILQRMRLEKALVD